LYTGQTLFEKGANFYDGALADFLHAYDILKECELTCENGLTDDNTNGSVGVQLVIKSAIESIGNAYKKQGKVDDAIAFYHQAVKLLVTKIGRKKHDVARLYFTLAELLTEQNDYNESLLMFTEAKDIFSSILGDRHPETASCYYKIGLVLREDPCRVSEALASLHKARDRWLKEYGSDNPDVIEAEKCIAEMEPVDNSQLNLG
jgi:tetratricopeptide (TPR) repeat protein